MRWLGSPAVTASDGLQQGQKYKCPESEDDHEIQHVTLRSKAPDKAFDAIPKRINTAFTATA